LNDKYVPHLRINQFYQAQLRAEKVANKDTISYIKEKLNAARFIMESIERRKDTIFRVTREIFEVQQGFFEEGVKGLHQLTLKKVADKLGLHESTISRVTNSKWAHTPRGVFQLKFFFSSGTVTQLGEDISSKHIKELVQEIVQSEDGRHPCSDSKIRAILKAKGIDIARRTVTKYREELGIRCAARRRQFA
ncbi:MAG: RNA polymerase sigma-54 factor, partial [Candidatus Riflebacteria bacterium]|nr:RNA polymerase sigma-54 factor [Candidatus Riflebacteria bacterium]